MSTLQVANVQFESTGANRIEYTGNNVIRVRANGGFQLPFGTTAQRAPGETGLMRYNTDTGLVETYGSGAWAVVPDGVTFNVAYTTANAGYVVANAAFGKANNALANTADVTFAGRFNIPDRFLVTQSTSGTNGILVNMPTDVETTAAGIRVKGYSPAIELMDKDSVQNWYMGIDDNDSNKLIFGRGYGPGQGVTQAITVNTSDNVGIGTATPNTHFEISKAVGAYWSVGAGAYTSRPQAITITNTTNGGYDPVLMFRQADQAGTVKDAGAIGLVGTASWSAADTAQQTSDMYFLVKNASNGISERMRIKSTGQLYMTSGQIQFPATQNASSDANTLDDYEEGTWTPNINSNNGAGTFTVKLGWYVKIGRKVTAWFAVDGGNSQAAGTTQYVTGLPFSVYSSFNSTECIGQMGTNGPSVRTQQLMSLSANRGVGYVYIGGTQETTTITFASGVLEYLTDS